MSTKRDIKETVQADLKKAHESLREIRRQQESLKASADRVEWQIAYLGGLLADSTPALFESPAAGGRFSGKTGPDVIRAILSESETPLSVGDIRDKAMAGGFGKEMDKVYRYFSSYLARMKKNPKSKIKKTGRGVFTIEKGNDEVKPA